jgi:hypothetical protein
LGKLRTAVGSILGTKYCPELAFRYDTWTPHVEVCSLCRCPLRVPLRRGVTRVLVHSPPRAARTGDVRVSGCANTPSWVL